MGELSQIVAPIISAGRKDDRCRAALSIRLAGERGRFRICSYHWMPSAACPRMAQKKNKLHAISDALTAQS